MLGNTLTVELKLNRCGLRRVMPAVNKRMEKSRGFNHLINTVSIKGESKYER